MLCNTIGKWHSEMVGHMFIRLHYNVDCNEDSLDFFKVYIWGLESQLILIYEFSVKILDVAAERFYLSTLSLIAAVIEFYKLGCFSYFFNFCGIFHCRNAG